MFECNQKVKDLVPYDPVTGMYRIRLDANESYITLPLEIKQEIAEAVSEIHYNRYPDPYAQGVCMGFAKYFHVPADCVTAGNGSDELISVIMNAFLQKGDTVMTLEKDFSMYAFYTSIVECRHVAYQKDESYGIDTDAVIRQANAERARVLIFSNPCNPTSHVMQRKEIVKLLTSVDALVVLDEAYMDFSDQSLLSEFDRYDNLIILKTCSKAMGAAAIRLGFAVANKTLTDVLKAVKSPYNVNAVTQTIGEILFSHPDYIDSCIKRLTEARDDLYARLLLLAQAYPNRLRLTPTQTNFVFAETSEAAEIFAYLKACGIVVRLMGDRLRITAGRNHENDAVCTEILNYLKGEVHEKSAN